MIESRTTPPNSSEIAFDEYGDRKSPVYELVNVQVTNSGGNTLKTVGTLKSDKDIDIRMEEIIWPGNQTEAPTGVFISNHLRVSKFLHFIVT